MNKLITSILVFALHISLSAFANSDATCHDATSRINTPHGLLKEVTCAAAPGSPQRYVTKWVLENKTLLSAYGPLGWDISNKNNSLVILHQFDDRLFLVDLATDKPRVFAFGIKNASNEFHWANWGKKRSVIAIKRNVKFVYENGKLTPPKKDNDLFLTIKPTMFETPVEKLDPFVEELLIK